MEKLWCSIHNLVLFCHKMWADESISLCAGPLLIASWQYCKGDVFPSFGGTLPDTFLNVKPFRLPQWIAMMRIGSSIARSKKQADE
jgi:hypothetical protein